MGLITICLETLVAVGWLGLVAIIFNMPSRREQIAIWTISIIAGIGSALLRGSQGGPNPDKLLFILFIIAPAVVGLASIIGLILSIMSPKPTAAQR